MKSPIRESQIEASVVAYCRRLGIHTRKFSSPAHRGVPDRILAYRGNVLFLELKRPGNEPTALQQHEIDLLRGAGCNADWCDSLEGAKRLIHLYLVNPGPI